MRTVIIIDDCEVDRYLARRMLRKSGIPDRVLEMAGAASALEFICDRISFEKQCGPWPPPVVLMLDINMPQMGGFEFLEEITRRVERGDIVEDCLVVAMYSSSSHQGDIDRSLKYPLVMDYIIKPINLEAVSRIADRVAAMQARAPAGAG